VIATMAAAANRRIRSWTQSTRELRGLSSLHCPRDVDRRLNIAETLAPCARKEARLSQHLFIISAAAA